MMVGSVRPEQSSIGFSGEQNLPGVSSSCTSLRVGDGDSESFRGTDVTKHRPSPSKALSDSADYHHKQTSAKCTTMQIQTMSQSALARH
jgi:hypothetical protein